MTAHNHIFPKETVVSTDDSHLPLQPLPSPLDSSSDVERMLLGAWLLNPDSLKECDLRSQWFGNDRYAMFAQAMTEVWGRTGTVDPVAVSEVFMPDQRARVLAELIQLQADCPNCSTVWARRYAQIILEFAAHRHNSPELVMAAACLEQTP
jgi:hypothetical protein